MPRVPTDPFAEEPGEHFAGESGDHFAEEPGEHPDCAAVNRTECAT